MRRQRKTYRHPKQEHPANFQFGLGWVPISYCDLHEYLNNKVRVNKKARRKSSLPTLSLHICPLPVQYIFYVPNNKFRSFVNAPNSVGIIPDNSFPAIAFFKNHRDRIHFVKFMDNTINIRTRKRIYMRIFLYGCVFVKSRDDMEGKCYCSTRKIEFDSVDFMILPFMITATAAAATTPPTIKNMKTLTNIQCIEECT